MILDVHAELLSMSLQHTEPQEVELPFRDPADSCLLLVHRQLQLTHDLAQVMQRRFGAALPAQDHEVIRVGDEQSAEASLKAEPSAEASLKAKLLPPQHEPAHVKIRQQW